MSKLSDFQIIKKLGKLTITHYTWRAKLWNHKLNQNYQMKQERENQ